MRKRSGFQVVFGPVRAGDLRAFLTEGLKTKGRMRVRDFGFAERLALVPMEIVPALKGALPAAAALFVISFILTGLSASKAFDWTFVALLCLTPRFSPEPSLPRFFCPGYPAGPFR